MEKKHNQTFNPLVLLYVIHWGKKKNVYFDICIERKKKDKKKACLEQNETIKGLVNTFQVSEA